MEFETGITHSDYDCPFSGVPLPEHDSQHLEKQKNTTESVNQQKQEQNSTYTHKLPTDQLRREPVLPVNSLFWVRSAGQELLVMPTSEAVIWGSLLYTFIWLLESGSWKIKERKQHLWDRGRTNILWFNKGQNISQTQKALHPGSPSVSGGNF